MMESLIAFKRAGGDGALTDPRRARTRASVPFAIGRGFS